MSNGILTILHSKVHGFINASVVWEDGLDAPPLEFRQFPTHEDALDFARVNSLVVRQEQYEVVTLTDK